MLHKFNYTRLCRTLNVSKENRPIKAGNGFQLGGLATLERTCACPGVVVIFQNIEAASAAEPQDEVERHGQDEGQHDDESRDMILHFLVVELNRNGHAALL